MAGKLTLKQQTFVQEYLVDLNAAQAAIRAGYSPDTARQQGARLLTNDDVTAALQIAMQRRSERTQITADRVLRELAALGFSDIRKAVRWYSQTNVAAIDTDADMQALVDEGEMRLAVANQVELISSKDIDDETALAISEISQTATGALKVKLYDKRAALVDIGKHLGMFTDRVEHSGSIVSRIERSFVSAAVAG